VFLKDSLWIFLELVPKGFDVEKISNKIKEISEVVDIHDVHVWSIGSSIPAFSAHVVVKDCLLSEADRVRKKIEGILINVGIKHSVIQIEIPSKWLIKQFTKFYCRILKNRLN